MTIRWTQPANDDFLGIVEWIVACSLNAAEPVGRRILAAVEQLAEFPFRGKPGPLPDTRELVISGLPYLVVYGTEADNPRFVVILRLLHGAMLWRPGWNSSGHIFCKARPIDAIEVRGICRSLTDRVKTRAHARDAQDNIHILGLRA